jgi:hypothetical protein
MRFVCDGKAYDTNNMELVKLDDFATAIYLDHGAGEAFLQTWDDAIGVRISRMTDDDFEKLRNQFGWGEGVRSDRRRGRAPVARERAAGTTRRGRY